MKKYKTIIVDDEIAACYRLKKLLDIKPQIEVISIESDPEIAIRNILLHKPDVLFLDVEMPMMSGFELLNHLLEKGLHIIVIFTTAYSHYAIKAIKERAFDYLLKPIDIDELDECIDRFKNIKSIAEEKIPEHILNVLSEREREVVSLLLQGHSSKEISEKLFISKSTVDTHRRNILDKTGYKSTAELISA